MSGSKKAGIIAFYLTTVLMSAVSASPAAAGSYNLTYHTTPNAENCSWIYQWKRVYGKRVKVKVKVCN